MTGIVTYFFGQAMTGQGMKHLYKELMSTEANTVYLLKGAHSFKISDLLGKLANHYSNKGVDVEYFLDPLFENTLEAIFVKNPYNILYLQATNPSVEPIVLGKRDKVISLYDCLDEQKLTLHGEQLEQLYETKAEYYQNCFSALANAIKIHDDWEVETRRYMNWQGLDKQFDELKNVLFGDAKQAKMAKTTHRLLGTLTPEGARDTVQSITQNLERRLFIKGYPGTGKSSMMKKLADEAASRGYDVQMVWCGLDSNSVDMVILPELKFCIFDSTEPHVYFPDESRAGDEILDIAQHCHPTEVEENNIQKIVAKYKSAISDATVNANLYAQEERKVREIIDQAIDLEEFDKRTKGLFI